MALPAAAAEPGVGGAAARIPPRGRGDAGPGPTHALCQATGRDGARPRAFFWLSRRESKSKVFKEASRGRQKRKALVLSAEILTDPRAGGHKATGLPGPSRSRDTRLPKRPQLPAMATFTLLLELKNTETYCETESKTHMLAK